MPKAKLLIHRAKKKRKSKMKHEIEVIAWASDAQRCGLRVVKKFHTDDVMVVQANL